MLKYFLFLVCLFLISKQLNCQTIGCGPSIDKTTPPNDCTKYYRCFNNQLYLLSCPKGFLFDTRLGVCFIAFLVKCVSITPPMLLNLTNFNAQVLKINELNSVTIHAFMPQPYIVNSFIIELRTRLVIIEFQLLPDAIANFQRYALSLNKTIDRCFLTHFHFDHFNGAPNWRNICPVYALPETISDLRYITSQNGYAYKQSADTLLQFIQPLTSLNPVTIDGVVFNFERVQGGENNNTLIISLPQQQAFFTADMALNQRHNYVPEVTDFGQYITILQGMQQKYSYRNMLPGHGMPTNFTAIQSNIDYINFIRNVASTVKTQAEYVALLTNRYPNYPPGIVPCPFTAPNCTLGIR